MEAEKLNILYVDDEPSNIRVFETNLKRHYTIFTALSGAEALKILEKNHIRLIITNQLMPNISGMELLKQATLKWPDIKSIMVTAYADINMVKEVSSEIGIFSSINKPFDFGEMKALIDGALQVYQVHNDEKKALLLMEEKANKFHNIFKAISDVFIRVNNDGIIEMISPSVYELFGYRPEEVIGKNSVNVFMDKENATNDFLLIKETRSCNNFETDLYAKDKSRLHVLVNFRIRTDEFDRPIGIDHLIRDVTQFKLQQKTLVENELKLKSFFDIAPVGIILNDMQGHFIEINREFSKFTGYSINELNKLSYWELTPDDYRVQEQIQLDSLAKINSFGPYEKEYIHRNGQRYPVLINGVKITGKNGEDLVWSVVKDITRQKKADDTIENQRERLALAVNAAQLGIWDWDISNNSLIWDDTAYSLYGLNKSDFRKPYDIWVSQIHFEDKTYIDAEILLALNGDKSFDTEFRVIWPDYSVHHIHATAKVIRDDQGTAIRMIGTNKDITEKKEAKIMLEALREVQASFITTCSSQIPFDNLLDVLLHTTASEYGFIGEIVVDKNKKPTLEIQAITNVYPNEEKGSFYKKITTEELNFKNLDALLKQVITTGKPIISNELYTDPYSEELSEHHSNLGSFMGMPLYNNDKLIGMVGVSNRPGGYNDSFIDKLELLLATCANLFIAKQNLANKQKIQQELVASETMLKTKNKELEQFAYIASHDLQEPLDTVSCFAKLLEEEYKGKLDSNADRYLDFIQQSTKRMKSLITGLLEYSRIGGKRKLEKVNCNKLLAFIEEDLHVLIQEKEAVITCEELPELLAYPIEMKQLFQNLISNALKYSQHNVPSIIHISTKKLKDGWQFKFMDNGIGIEEEFKEKIFIIFQRLHNKEDYEGTGIGLAQCRKIVTMHNGEIWMKSNLNAGSAFYFTIKTNEQ
ncbi:PAS domain S-box protein [Maribacter sp. ACAM166]|uniref:PAS domain S-box protein n=1 Tax=Maribacter sp. ACAM166 TaxID=2508996 RepID=UPI0010FDC685|nr:PAS domain S-box protein [Maribacter sp. ACAM166]TLP80123.1 PAS domain S-box protein [Maribacter sp. ACAM166]